MSVQPGGSTEQTLRCRRSRRLAMESRSSSGVHVAGGRHLHTGGLREGRGGRALSGLQANVMAGARSSHIHTHAHKHTHAHTSSHTHKLSLSLSLSLSLLMFSPPSPHLPTSPSPHCPQLRSYARTLSLNASYGTSCSRSTTSVSVSRSPMSPRHVFM